MSQAPSVHKPRRSTDEEEARQVLREGKIGVLSLASPQGEPYGVPLNYVYDGEENALYCHCFVRGRKLEFLAANPRVSFVVAVDVEAAPSRFITHYRVSTQYRVSQAFRQTLTNLHNSHVRWTNRLHFIKQLTFYTFFQHCFQFKTGIKVVFNRVFR